MKSKQFKFSTLMISFCLSVSCTKVITRGPSEPPEPTFCSTIQSHSPSYTITGTARYEKREITSDGLAGLVVPNPVIRGAEIQIVDADGTIIQCAETDASGNFSFTVPQSSETYTVKILSRSYSDQSKASILKSPETNIPHEVTTTFVADSTKSIGTIVASADITNNANPVSGAFNILDQIYSANKFLIDNTSAPYKFSVTQKVQAYWDKGVNPVTYFGGDANSGVSFYVPGSDKLYILGGIDGDITVEDTDHFDDHIIVHEYGHFIEDNYAITDSPGGAHYGTYVIDPRLAWSEAFATFLATQVLNDPIYKDTIGIYSGPGTGGMGFYYDAENNQNLAGNPMDVPAADEQGEGNFRELAVLRFLWDAIDSTGFTFDEFWEIFTGTFKNTDPFREMSLFLEKQAADGSTDLSSMYTNNLYEVEATRAHFGTRDNTATANNAADPLCQWTIQANAKLPSIAGSNIYKRSNQYYSNDFFHYYHPGGALSVTLNYQTAGSDADLDLYIYKDDYSYGYSNDLLVYSNKGRCPSTGSCETGTESISVSAPVGHYMINVMYALEYSNCSDPNDATDAGCDPTTYTLRIGGSNYICR